jgi:hypothetical protein
MSAEQGHKLYEKILDIKLVLRDLQDEFKTYSAQDIKKLIGSKLKSVKKGPAALQELYRLEAMITDLREAFVLAKDEYLNSQMQQAPPPPV